MDEELKKRLIDALDSMATWTGEQVPLAAQEVIAWTFVSSVMFGCLAIVGATVAGWGARRCFAAYKKAEEQQGGRYVGADPIAIVGMIMLSGACFGLSLSAIINLSTAVKCKVAPRVVVIEAVRGYAR